MSEDQHVKKIRRIYNCSYCKRTHSIQLEENMADEKPRYPFPFVFLHSSEGELNDLLTTLYLDAQLQIRGVEVVKLDNSDIFSETLTKKITEKLMEMIVKLEEENLQLRGLLHQIDFNSLNEADETKPSEKKFRIYILSIIEGEERKDLLIQGQESVEDLKQMAAEVFGFSIEQFHLSFEGVLLKDHMALPDYNIQNGDELVLIPKTI